jgi:HlyD family secretion protein
MEAIAEPLSVPVAPPALPLPRPKRRVPWRWIIVGAAACAVAGGVFGFTRYRRAHRRPVAQLETARVDRGKIVARVTATGTLSALVTVQVGSQVSGRVQSLHADFNTAVRKGQVVAEIDPRMFRAAVEQAQANLIGARGNLEKARVQSAQSILDWKRAKMLRDGKLNAVADLDLAQANRDAAAAQVIAADGAVAQARAALHQAQLNLEYTRIVSPTNGVVISRNVDVGQTVAATLAAPTLFVIAEDLRAMQVDTSVAEADIGKLRPGMEATFSVDAYPGERFRGVVRQLRNAPQTVQNVVTYDAVIDVANPDLRLKPGMTANVSFVYAEKSNVVRVPNAALRFRAPPTWPAPAERREQTDLRTVWLTRAGKPAAVQVRIGIGDGTSTELVEGGLAVGDALITDAGGGSGAPAGFRVF